MEFITEPSRQINVKEKTDILVLGGGPSGLAAAVSAAKEGVTVTVVERNGYFGGQATGGYVLVLCGLNDKSERIVKGFCEELIQHLESLNATKPWHNFIVFDQELLKLYFDHCIRAHGIRPILNTVAVQAVMEEDKITHVLIESKSGRQAIEAKIVIDCTGDADTLKFCNEKFIMAEKDHLRAVTSTFLVGGVNVDKASSFIKTKEYIELLNESGLNIHPWHWTFTVKDRFAWFDMSHVFAIDITDVDSLTTGEMQARELASKHYEYFKKHIPGFEESYIASFAPLLGIRDSRRLLAKHFITEKDYGKDFEDTICFAPYYFAKGGIDKLKIPYRSLIPQTVKNLLVAGRAIGIEHKLIDCIRELPCCFATGQAAGIASKLALDVGYDVNNIDIKSLQDTIKAQGGYL